MGKKEKSNKKNNNDNDDLKKGQKLQAILLAVSFTKYFRPLSYIKPKVLLPLVNIPMLMYTIEFLAQNGVEEIFIFCVRHVEMIQQFVNKLNLPSNISIRCILSRSCLSQGDALRELDVMGIIRSDPFILINGDVISNMDLRKAINFHKEKRQQDSNCIMTVVLKQNQKNSGVRPLSQDLVVAQDRNTQQLLLFENDISKTGVKIPLQIFESHPGVRIRTDLLDCQIDICSPELLLQFSDNFDYQDIRQHFIKNEVVNWELGEHIYSYVIEKEYAAQVTDFRTYHHICHDIIHRRVYPFVPDARMMSTDYVQGKYYVYKESGAKIARSARIGHGVVFGKGTIVEDDVEIHRTVIGRNCIIRKGSRVIDSHIFNDVTIEPNSTIISSIIGENSTIKSGSSIQRGCVLSNDIVVDTNVTLGPFTRVGSCKHPDEELSEGEDEESSGNCDKTEVYDTSVLGSGGIGYVWKYGNEVGDEFGLGDIDDPDYIYDSEYSHLLPGGKDAAFRATSMGCVEEEKWKSSLWKVSDEIRDSDSEQGEDEQEAHFEVVVSDMVTSGYADGHPTDSIALEIKSYKFAQNKDFSDCVRGVIPALLSVILKETSSKGPPTTNKLIKGITDMFKEDMWGYKLIKHFLQEFEDQFAFIESVEDFAIREEKKQIYSVVRYILQLAYQSELLSEEVLIKWANDRENSEDPDSFRKELYLEEAIQEFVKWLRETAEESDDDDEEEDDEDDENDDDA